MRNQFNLYDPEAQNDLADEEGERPSETSYNWNGLKPDAISQFITVKKVEICFQIAGISPVWSEYSTELDRQDNKITINRKTSPQQNICQDQPALNTGYSF